MRRGDERVGTRRSRARWGSWAVSAAPALHYPSCNNHNEVLTMRTTIWASMIAAALLSAAGCKKRDDSAKAMDKAATSAQKAQEDVHDQMKDVNNAEKDVTKEQKDVTKEENNVAK